MVTGKQQLNLQQAKRYFEEHLSNNDYYSEGQTTCGVWRGKGVKRLGLKEGSPVTKEAFDRLCDNCHPLTGQKLTVRQKKAARRIYVDFVVSPPKSVSVMALLLGDSRLVDAFTESANAVFVELESLAATRVRSKGRVAQRTTGELIAPAFLHDTSRSLDPQLHMHFTAFNATWDPVECRWKALETWEIFDRMNYLTEFFRAHLVRKIEAIGYKIRVTSNGFEIAGVSEEIIERFSKGRTAILKEAERRERISGKPLTNNGRAIVAHEIRPKKLKHLSKTEVLALQLAQLSENERLTLKAIKDATHPLVSPKISENRKVEIVRNLPTREEIQFSLQFAKEHLFERRSAVSKANLVTTAVKHAGYRFTADELERELMEDQTLLRVGDLFLQQSGVREEKRLLFLANSGIGVSSPYSYHALSFDHLTSEQANVANRLLRNEDRIVILHGLAGSGKSEVLRTISGIARRKNEVHVLAPTHGSVRSLVQGGINATTVQSFLSNPKLMEALKAPTLIVDEAGLLSTKQMLALSEFVTTKRGRLILSGDHRQHSSIDAGDALRLIQTKSNVHSISLKEIRRQEDEDYREAVKSLAAGRAEETLARLWKMGAVKVIEDDAQRLSEAAKRYVSTVGGSAVIVSPTWQEVDAANEAVRVELKARRILSGEETNVKVLRSLKWTEAQKRDRGQYKIGHVLTFHKSTREFRVGDSVRVLGKSDRHLLVGNGNKVAGRVTSKQAKSFDVAEEIPIPVSVGDKLLLQVNRKRDGFLNGQIVEVKSFGQNGSIRLKDGRTLPKNYRQFNHGYAATSYAAQGRTVDEVILLVDQNSYASNSKYLYVAASRGRKRLTILTDKWESVESAAKRSASRITATEVLLQKHNTKESIVQKAQVC